MNTIRILSAVQDLKESGKPVSLLRHRPLRFSCFTRLRSRRILSPSKEIFAMILLGTIGWRALHATQADITGYLDEHWAETKMMLFSSNYYNRVHCGSALHRYRQISFSLRLDVRNHRINFRRIRPSRSEPSRWFSSSRTDSPRLVSIALSYCTVKARFHSRFNSALFFLRLRRVFFNHIPAVASKHFNADSINTRSTG